MREPIYWRAVYNETRQAFVVDEAGWIGDQPEIEYRFVFYEDEAVGVLERCWMVEEGVINSEVFAFGEYVTYEAFRADVDQILKEAKERSQSENLDAFLAVIDVVKERAIVSGIDDESIFHFEGLFEYGPEDAYTRREGVFDESRLHDHVERSKDECWRLHSVKVVDAGGNTLGWALVVLLYADLTSNATEEEVQTASRAELLELEHWHNKSAAELSRVMTDHFMTQGGRLEDPDLAFSNDSEVFDFLSVQMSHGEIPVPEWDVLEGDNLRDLVNGERALVRDTSCWYPNDVDLVMRYATETGLSPHFADQFHAYLLDNMGLSEEFDEDSPWRFLDEKA